MIKNAFFRFLRAAFLPVCIVMCWSSLYAQKKPIRPVMPASTKTTLKSATAQALLVDKYTTIDRIVRTVPTDSAVSVSVLAGYIQAHCQTDEERVRAIYWWLALTIQYDVDNLYALDFSKNTDQIINSVFATHKAICIGYATVFMALCEQVGVKSYLISGYIKHGKMIEPLGHAWNAASINGKWYLFDPTWGAGVVENKRFIAEPNDIFFMVPPTEFIPTHMPFDPMWQFVERPVTHHAFNNGDTHFDLTQPYFNFQDSIRVYQTLSLRAQMQATIRRGQQKGDRNLPLYTYLMYLKQNLTQVDQNLLVNQFNSAIDQYRQTIHQVNAFIDYRNRMFVPERSEAEVRAALDSISLNLAQVKAALGTLPVDNEEVRNNIARIKPPISEVDKFLVDQQAFISKYYNTRKIFRKMLFRK